MPPTPRIYRRYKHVAKTRRFVFLESSIQPDSCQHSVLHPCPDENVNFRILPCAIINKKNINHSIKYGLAHYQSQ